MVPIHHSGGPGAFVSDSVVITFNPAWLPNRIKAGRAFSEFKFPFIAQAKDCP